MMKELALFLLLVSASAFALPECGANQSQPNHAGAGSANLSTSASATSPGGLNGVVVWGFYNDYACTSNYVGYLVATVDTNNPSGNYYGMALVNTSGTVLCTTGGLTGTVFSVTQGVGPTWQPWTTSCTVPQGQLFYVVGTTCTAQPTGCAVLGGDVAKGAWYWAIAANKSSSPFWTFSSSGFSGFTAANLPANNLTLSTTGNSITTTTATVTVTTAQVSHIYPSATYITVSGVTTGGATGLNCANCLVTAVTPGISTSTISYTVPSSSWSGTINGGNVFAPPSMAGQSGLTPPYIWYF